MQLSIARNLSNDLYKIIDEELKRSGDSYIAASVALNVVERLRAEDPELLSKFLDQYAIHVVHRLIVQMDGSKRLQVKAAAERRKLSVFQDAVDRHEAGEKGALVPWLDTVYVVTGDNLRRRLTDMDKDDLEYAASKYTDRARANAVQAAFLRALAAKVGAGTVGDYFDDEQLSRLWVSIQ